MATNDLPTNLELIDQYTKDLANATEGATATTAAHEKFVKGGATETVDTDQGPIKTLSGQIEDMKDTANTEFQEELVIINQTFDTKLGEYDVDFANYLLTLGFQLPVPYESGLEITKRSQTVSNDGLIYFWTLDLPYTTSGNFEDNNGFQIAPITGGVEVPLFSLDEGGVLNNQTQSVLGNDGQWYYWNGSFPKIIPENSTIVSAGGLGKEKFKTAGGFLDLRPSLETMIQGTGHTLNAKTFELGATLVSNKELLLEASSGRLYRWMGNIPKIVDFNSTPETSGGIGENSWKEFKDFVDIFRFQEMVRNLGFRVAGNFIDGCTVSTQGEIVFDSDKTPYIWNGSLPRIVNKNEDPSLNDSWSEINISSPSASYSNSGKTVQTFIDETDTSLGKIDNYLELKIFQSPTDGDLTEIQTRTANASEVYEVRKTSDDSLATIYSDAAGTTEIAQNGTDNKSGSDGVVEFYIAVGSYVVSSGGDEKTFTVNSTSETINPRDHGLVGDGIADDRGVMEVVLAKAKDESKPLMFGGDDVYISGDEIDFSWVSVVGSVYIKGATVKWFRSKQIKQTGGVFKCDNLFLSGIWYSGFEYLWCLGDIFFDGGGQGWGSFWNTFGVTRGSLHLNADSHSVNQNTFQNTRGGLYLSGGFEGNTLPQEIDQNVFEMIDTTGANMTASDGRTGYQILDERYSQDRTNRIKSWYGEVSGDSAIRGNFHIDGMTNIGPTSSIELPQWNHVLNTSQWTNRGSSDFFAGSPKSNLAIGGLWDIIDGDGKPLSFSQTNANAAVISDSSEPSGIGFSYGGSTDIPFSSLRVRLSSSREGKYGVFAWIYAPDGVGNIQYGRGGNPNTVAGNIHYWDRGDGWRLYRIAGGCRSDGEDEELTIFMQGGSPTAAREVRLGGVWASPQKTAFLPCVVPDTDIKGSVESRPSTGDLIALPIGQIAYNADQSMVSGSPLGWRKNADGSFSEISTELPFSKTIGKEINVPANTATTLFTVTESTYNGGVSGRFEIYWTNSKSSPDFRGATGYQKAVFSLLADGDLGTHESEINIVESTWLERNGSIAPTLTISQSGNIWSIQATVSAPIGDSTAYIKSTIYDSEDLFSF